MGLAHFSVSCSPLLIYHFFRWYSIYRQFTLIISFRNYYMSTFFSCIHRFCL